MEDMILREIVVLFILSIIVVLVCLRFRLPSIVGFLLTGVLCGPSALGLIPSPEAVDTMADVGVAFLMFSIGMELSGKELVRLKKPLFLGGSSQVLLTMAFVFLLTFWWSGPRLGIVYGCLVTLSPTAIVLSSSRRRSPNPRRGRSASPCSSFRISPSCPWCSSSRCWRAASNSTPIP